MRAASVHRLPARATFAAIFLLHLGNAEQNSGEQFADGAVTWFAKPSRDAAWYQETKTEVLHRTHSLDEMAEQYPATDEEALAPPNYGGRFKADWFRDYLLDGNFLVFGEKRYREENVRRRFLAVDPAASVKETAKDDPDWTVISG